MPRTKFKNGSGTAKPDDLGLALQWLQEQGSTSATDLTMEHLHHAEQLNSTYSELLTCHTHDTAKRQVPAVTHLLCAYVSKLLLQHATTSATTSTATGRNATHARPADGQDMLVMDVLGLLVNGLSCCLKLMQRWAKAKHQTVRQMIDSTGLLAAYTAHTACIAASLQSEQQTQTHWPLYYIFLLDLWTQLAVLFTHEDDNTRSQHGKSSKPSRSSAVGKSGFLQTVLPTAAVACAVLHAAWPPPDFGSSGSYETCSNDGNCSNDSTGSSSSSCSSGGNRMCFSRRVSCSVVVTADSRELMTDSAQWDDNRTGAGTLRDAALATVLNVAQHIADIVDCGSQHNDAVARSATSCNHSGGSTVMYDWSLSGHVEQLLLGHLALMTHFVHLQSHDMAQLEAAAPAATSSASAVQQVASALGTCSSNGSATATPPAHHLSLFSAVGLPDIEHTLVCSLLPADTHTVYTAAQQALLAVCRLVEQHADITAAAANATADSGRSRHVTNSSASWDSVQMHVQHPTRPGIGLLMSAGQRLPLLLTVTELLLLLLPYEQHEGMLPHSIRLMRLLSDGCRQQPESSSSRLGRSSHIISLEQSAAAVQMANALAEPVLLQLSAVVLKYATRAAAAAGGGGCGQAHGRPHKATKFGSRDHAQTHAAGRTTTESDVAEGFALLVLNIMSPVDVGHVAAILQKDPAASQAALDASIRAVTQLLLTKSRSATHAAAECAPCVTPKHVLGLISTVVSTLRHAACHSDIPDSSKPVAPDSNTTSTNCSPQHQQLQQFVPEAGLLFSCLKAVTACSTMLPPVHVLHVLATMVNQQLYSGMSSLVQQSECVKFVSSVLCKLGFEGLSAAAVAAVYTDADQACIVSNVTSSMGGACPGSSSSSCSSSSTNSGRLGRGARGTSKFSHSSHATAPIAVNTADPKLMLLIGRSLCSMGLAIQQLHDTTGLHWLDNNSCVYPVTSFVGILAAVYALLAASQKLLHQPDTKNYINSSHCVGNHDTLPDVQSLQAELTNALGNANFINGQSNKCYDTSSYGSSSGSLGSAVATSIIHAVFGPGAANAHHMQHADTPALAELDMLVQLQQVLPAAMGHKLVQLGMKLCTQLPTVTDATFCANPSCTNCECNSEQELVCGQGLMCSGCKAVRFCSVECSKAYWKAGHMAVCRRLKQSPVQRA